MFAIDVNDSVASFQEGLNMYVIRYQALWEKEGS